MPHCRRRPRSAHRLLLSHTCLVRVQDLRPCSSLCSVPGPGIFPRTRYLLFHLSRRPRLEHLLFPNPGPSSLAEPGHLRPLPVPRVGTAPARCKPQSRTLPRRPPTPRIQPGPPPLTQDRIAAEGQRLLPRRPRNQPLGRRGRGLTLGQPSFGQ